MLCFFSGAQLQTEELAKALTLNASVRHANRVASHVNDVRPGHCSTGLEVAQEIALLIRIAIRPRERLEEHCFVSVHAAHCMEHARQVATLDKQMAFGI